MRIVLLFGMAAGVALSQQGPPGGPVSFIRMSPILNAIDVNQDGVLSAAEIADAPVQLRKLDKNNDGKLTRDEAGLQLQRGRGGRGGEGERGGRGGDEGPAAPPTAAELTETLMAFDANKNGQLEKSEVPERMQGMFDRGDTNHDGVLTRDEIIKLAEANRQQASGGEGGGRGPGPGPGQFDLAFSALDTDQNGEISADEIKRAATALKTLDKNGDGRITEDEVTPAFGRGRGFGRGAAPGGADRPQ